MGRMSRMRSVFAFFLVASQLGQNNAGERHSGRRRDFLDLINRKDLSATHLDSTQAAAPLSSDDSSDSAALQDFSDHYNPTAQIENVSQTEEVRPPHWDDILNVGLPHTLINTHTRAHTHRAF